MAYSGCYAAGKLNSNFIDAHRGNQHIQLCGKLAIARCILEAEKGSKLATLTEHEMFDFANLEDAWLNSFFRLLVEDVSRESLTDVFENVSFISFNYDRCVEHFLVHALSNYYELPIKEAQQITKTLRILHPYGTVGTLPFGEVDYHTDLFSVAQQIRTYTERIDEEAALAAIQSEIQGAQVAVFSGICIPSAKHESLAAIATGVPTGICHSQGHLRF